MGKFFAVPSNPEDFEDTKTTLVLDRNPHSTLDSPPRPFDQSTAMLYHPSGHIHPMSLLDLPAELLALVAHHVGVLELRKFVTYLLIVKRTMLFFPSTSFSFHSPISTSPRNTNWNATLTRNGTAQSNTNKDQMSACPPCWSP